MNDPNRHLPRPIVDPFGGAVKPTLLWLAERATADDLVFVLGVDGSGLSGMHAQVDVGTALAILIGTAHAVAHADGPAADLPVSVALALDDLWCSLLALGVVREQG